jgi:hypothetical protein
MYPLSSVQIGAATWMHYVTKEQTWLDQAAM